MEGGSSQTARVPTVQSSSSPATPGRSRPFARKSRGGKTPPSTNDNTPDNANRQLSWRSNSGKPLEGDASSPAGGSSPRYQNRRGQRGYRKVKEAQRDQLRQENRIVTTSGLFSSQLEQSSSTMIDDLTDELLPTKSAMSRHQEAMKQETTEDLACRYSNSSHVVDVNMLKHLRDFIHSENVLRKNGFVVQYLGISQLQAKRRCRYCNKSKMLFVSNFKSNNTSSNRAVAICLRQRRNCQGI
jgi:hypothetical protein